MCTISLFTLFMVIDAVASFGLPQMFPNLPQRQPNTPTARAKAHLSEPWYDVEANEDIDMQEFFDAEEDSGNKAWEAWEKEWADVETLEEFDTQDFFDIDEEFWALQERVKVSTAKNGEVPFTEQEKEDLEFLVQLKKDGFVVLEETREFADLQNEAGTSLSKAIQIVNEKLPEWMHHRNVAEYGGAVFSFVYGPETSRWITRSALGASLSVASWVVAPAIIPFLPFTIELLAEEVGALVKRNKIAVGKKFGEFGARFGKLVFDAALEVVPLICNLKLEREKIVELLFVVGSLALSFAKVSTVAIVKLVGTFVSHVFKHATGVAAQLANRLKQTIFNPPKLPKLLKSPQH